MLAPGMHINAVGGDWPGKTQLAADVLMAARVFVEYPPQTRVEGDIQQMPADFAVTELWQVLAGQQPGRVAAEDITEFDSVVRARRLFRPALHARRRAGAGFGRAQRAGAGDGRSEGFDGLLRLPATPDRHSPHQPLATRAAATA